MASNLVSHNPPGSHFPCVSFICSIDNLMVARWLPTRNRSFSLPSDWGSYFYPLRFTRRMSLTGCPENGPLTTSCQETAGKGKRKFVVQSPHPLRLPRGEGNVGGSQWFLFQASGRLHLCISGSPAPIACGKKRRNFLSCPFGDPPVSLYTTINI